MHDSNRFLFCTFAPCMGRILAIDYGKKRTGIAVTDILQIIANGLTTVATSELMDFLLKYIEKEPVERIIVGHPKQMNNEDSENMKRIVPFVNQLKKKLPQIPVEMIDERFTSVLAHQAMLDGGRKPARTRHWWMKSVQRLFYNRIWNRRNISLNYKRNRNDFTSLYLRATCVA